MRPFGERDASWFFGRDAEIDDLVGRLDRGEREIYVIGPSGSGKSSLVHAGLFPVLDAGASRLGRMFVIRSMRPGERPADRLAQLLEADLAAPVATVEAFAARHAPAERALVFVDQLEELFTVATADERQRFVAALCALRPVPRCCVVLALRADFFGALLDSELGSDLAGRISPLVVAPLRGESLARAIRAPATRVGVHVEPRLCERLVADAADEPASWDTTARVWDAATGKPLAPALEHHGIVRAARGLHGDRPGRGSAMTGRAAAVRQGGGGGGGDGGGDGSSAVGSAARGRWRLFHSANTAG